MTNAHRSLGRRAISWPLVAVVTVAGVAIVAMAVATRGRDEPTGADPSQSAGAVASAPVELESAPATPSVAATGLAAPSAPSQASTQPAIASVAEPVSAIAGDPTIAWTEGPVIEGMVTAAAWIDGRWFVGGSAGGRAAVWTSQDGSTWSAAPPIDPAPGPDGDGAQHSYAIDSFAEWEGRIVAVGAHYSELRDVGFLAMWTSTDSQTWDYREIADTQGPPSRGVAISPDERLIIIGGRGSVHVTTDGESWDVTSLGSPDTYRHIAEVAGGPPTLRGVGTSSSVQVTERWRDPVAAIWASPDWVTWEPLVTGSPGVLAAVTYEPQSARFFAGGWHLDGTDNPPFPAAWLSHEGNAWSSVILDQRRGEVNDVDGANGVLLAVGGVYSETREIVVWESRDGTTWAATSLGPDVRGSPSVVTHGGRAILLVSTVEPGSVETRTWTATIEP